MVSEAFGVEIDEIELPHGCRALLVSGPEDRPAYVPPPPPVKYRRDPLTGQRVAVPSGTKV